MLYSGLEVIAYNQKRKASDLRLYEFGETYRKNESGWTEQNHLQLILSGNSAGDSWLAKGTAYNFYHLKKLCAECAEPVGPLQL